MPFKLEYNIEAMQGHKYANDVNGQFIFKMFMHDCTSPSKSHHIVFVDA